MIPPALATPSGGQISGPSVRVPTPSFTDLAGYDQWCRQWMVEWNRTAVTDPDEWERIAIRVEGLLRKINGQQQEAA